MISLTFVGVFSFLVGVIVALLWVHSWVSKRLVDDGYFFFPYVGGILVATDAKITVGAITAEADIEFNRKLLTALGEYTEQQKKITEDLK